MSPNKTSRFTVLSMNVHKGVSPLHRHSTIYQLREKMRSHHPDLLFLQELQQEHRGRVRRFSQWPLIELTHFLSEDFWRDWHYGKNVEYRDGHHGNAILSKHPQQKGNNYDISAYRFESRGLLHSVTTLDGMDQPIHCFCVHLALFERGRERQLEAIIGHIQELTQNGPTIVAGDFNDWRNRVSAPMKAAGFDEVFELLTGSPAKTFPSMKPLLSMDRIYVRGIKVHSAEILYEWLKLSDHLGITAELELE
ncbi:endonuclease/exonuclease/phosphatase family protein [Polynucleobacter sp. MG-28-Ekke-A2]|uniref:endonuclease/exonuclease/phosphatase family protein n=1 Tax=unclassified Polynucleobacter TaxID=2640945 RepID=UPI001C0AEF9C|nr:MULTISPECIES: endonuclease/exonuclease/phosphatase family protein [unclassified Polynucleobacter]MBU3549442.1 endonuclease/exonuclease/phosphatase family protein [Polynucleobacter sp. P1-05-14]MEA9601819.1 endonuclease/exonuclease/phosphatase family protein [Polynucleobacter sp. MG-28-Ekke-A2]